MRPAHTQVTQITTSLEIRISDGITYGGGLRGSEKFHLPCKERNGPVAINSCVAEGRQGEGHLRSTSTSPLE
eukprot:2286921-Amphidinium_carterae.2